MRRPGGVEDIVHGEVWRLVTPIFLHFGFIHLLFNMWALASLGSLIEYRRGTATLALLVLLSAMVSNLGEYLYEVNFFDQARLFGGMSGVVYALFGYIWMKGQNEPEQGMILHPSTVQTMLFWLVLCMMGFVGKRRQRRAPGRGGGGHRLRAGPALTGSDRDPSDERAMGSTSAPAGRSTGVPGSR